MGKTLCFWLPLLFRPNGIQIVVTPLNLLGKQNAASLTKAGISAIVSRIDRFSLGPNEEGSKRGRDSSRGGSLGSS